MKGKQKESRKRANGVRAKAKRRSAGSNNSRQSGRGSERLSPNLESLMGDLEILYKDIHSHPELSMQETRTAGIAAKRLKAAGYEVTTQVGKTGVVGVLRNGDGPTVMLRADMDALPVKEETGLPYASAVTMEDAEGNNVPVMHACGHDMHVTWLVGATTLFAKERDRWRGTLMAVFQPGEETAQGAQAMIEDKLFTRFPKPDVVLGQHVMVGPSGAIGGGAASLLLPPIVFRFGCSDAAHTGRCRRRALIQSSWRRPQCCVCRRLSLVRSHRTMAQLSRLVHFRQGQRRM